MRSACSGSAAASLRPDVPTGRAKRAYLLTGRPGVGKTTCLKKTLERLHVPAEGFFTEEVRREGKRVGFGLLALGGRRATLASVDRSGPPRVGKYGVNLDALDSVGVPAIYEGIRTGSLVVIDEIGKMEMTSPAFRRAVEATLESGAPILGTMLRASDPWADRVKAHPVVQLIEVTPANRDALPAELAARLRPLARARPR